jgi:hypothetical protein
MAQYRTSLGRILLKWLSRLRRRSNVNILHFLLASAVFATATGISHAQQLILPSDVGVTLTATPSANLVPGQPIDLTLTVTNYGQFPVTELPLSSSQFVDELNLISSSGDCFVVTIVADLQNGGFYDFLSWLVTISEPFNAGETLTCHFLIALTSQAPQALPFSFGLPPDVADPNPSNDRVTVLLLRPVEPVPALSSVWLLLLAGMVVIAGYLFERRSTQVGVSNANPNKIET